MCRMFPPQVGMANAVKCDDSALDDGDEEHRRDKIVNVQVHTAQDN